MIMRKEKGITLIALIVTIIILIILAGISINLLLGENGIVDKANKSKELAIISEITEKLELEKSKIALENYNNIYLNSYLDLILPNTVIANHTISLEFKNTFNTYAYILVDNKYEYLLEQEENNNLKITYKGIASLIDSITLIPESITLQLGETHSLTTILLPESSTNKSVVWESSNPDIASVDSNGLISAKSEGEAIITATAIHGINKKATCKVTVSYASLKSVAKSGDYVIYEPISKSYIVTTGQSGYSSDQSFSTDGSTNLWQILYNDDSLGIQITSSKSIANVNIGRNNSNANAKLGYNNVISTLNFMSDNYINPKYAISARTIGSNPENREDTTTSTITTPFKYNGSTINTGFKKEDNFYEKDFNALNTSINQDTNGIAKIDVSYFLGSRYVYTNPNDCVVCYIRTIDTNGSLNTSRIVACSDGAGLSDTWGMCATSGVRPVIKLINDIKILDGDGSKDNPYILKPIE